MSKTTILVEKVGGNEDSIGFANRSARECPPAQTQEGSRRSLEKRKYQDAMGYENEDPEIQQQKLDIKYEKIPNFPKELFETSDGLQQIADWFDGYNEYISSKYSISLIALEATTTKSEVDKINQSK